MTITFDGGVTTFIGDKWIAGDKRLESGFTEIGPLIKADTLKAGFSAGQGMIYSSQHGLVFEQGSKIECTNTQKVDVIYKLLD